MGTIIVNDEGEPTGEGLLGKPEFFISHWWGYKAVDLLTMVLAHDSERTAAGEPHAAYFLDMFVLNQHQMTKDCTTDEDKHAQLVDSLRFSLRACGTLLLCCTSGPSGDAGWERPAPNERVRATIAASSIAPSQKPRMLERKTAVSSM